MSFSDYASPSPPVVTVSELNRYAKQLLEKNIPLMWIAGEISNLTRATSGHWYFTLKDDSAQVRCAMFRHKNQYLDWRPENGMQVEVRALVTLYEQRGEFQLSVENLRRSGLGALYEAFEKLKARLSAEGLFDDARKKPLPLFPRQIGVITSPAAAALRDVLTTLRRRMPGIPVVLYPTPVQGEGAGAKVADALRSAALRSECDVLILCRGGGSIEDLWAFNEESVARAVADSPIPVVCGVGHETDFTIADFVADRRAPTPTAAAEMASPDRLELIRQLGGLESRLTRQLNQALEQRISSSITWRAVWCTPASASPCASPISATCANGWDSAPAMPSGKKPGASASCATSCSKSNRTFPDGKPGWKNSTGGCTALPASSWPPGTPRCSARPTIFSISTRKMCWSAGSA